MEIDGGTIVKSSIVWVLALVTTASLIRDLGCHGANVGVALERRCIGRLEHQPER